MKIYPDKAQVKRIRENLIQLEFVSGEESIIIICTENDALKIRNKINLLLDEYEQEDK